MWKDIWRRVFKPTEVYVKQAVPALSKGYVKVLAHITVGGLWDDIP